MSTAARLWWKRRLARWPPLYRLARRARRLLAGRSSAEGVWDDRVARVEGHDERGWLDSELIEREYIRPRISGSPDVYYVEHFVERHLRESTGRLLSLGCGGGHLERQLMDLEAAPAIDALDSSPASIELATRLAAQAGLDSIHYSVSDLNTASLGVGRYRAVVAKQSLHHVERLEHVYEQIARCLEPGGLLMFNEYVGPDRFQWSDRQLELANELFRSLPRELRALVGLPGIERPRIADVVADDPSESARSSEILPLLAERFEILEHKPYGGTLLNLVLTPAIPYLDEADPEHRAIFRRCFDAERRALEEGEIGHDFAYVVARPRPV